MTTGTCAVPSPTSAKNASRMIFMGKPKLDRSYFAPWAGLFPHPDFKAEPVEPSSPLRQTAEELALDRQMAQSANSPRT